MSEEAANTFAIIAIATVIIAALGLLAVWRFGVNKDEVMQFGSSIGKCYARLEHIEHMSGIHGIGVTDNEWRWESRGGVCYKEDAPKDAQSYLKRADYVPERWICL